MRFFIGFVLLARSSAWLPILPAREMSVAMNGFSLDFIKAPPSRELQTVNQTMNSTTGCSICDGNAVLNTSFLIPDQGLNLTCEEWESTTVNFIEVGSEACQGIKALFLYCCQSPPRYQCEKRIRSGRLSGYDVDAPPLEEQNGMVDVDVNMIFLTVTELNVQKGTAEIFVWLELTWNDPRLAWNMNAFNCSERVTMRASVKSDESEIWVPDFDLLNVVSGVQNFPVARAEVQFDGKVYWRRGGSLKAICQYQNLAKIPFDQLGCQFILGAWTRYEHVNYELHNGTGFQFGDFTPTYNEYKLLEDLVETSKHEGEPFLSYVFYFERATSYYISNLVIPTAIITYVSFGNYLLDFRVGERLAFGASLTFIAIAQQIVIAGLLPVSGVPLWISTFVSLSFYFVLFGLVQSVFIAYVFFLQQDLTTQTKQQSGDSQAPSPISKNSDENLEHNAVADSEDVVTPVSANVNTRASAQPSTPTKQRALLNQRLRTFILSIRLRLVDHVCFFIAVIGYSIFLIVMFTTVPGWGQNVDPEYS